MTKTQAKLLESILTHGHATVMPGTREHSTAKELLQLFPLIERETQCGGVTVYMYRLNDHCIRVAQANFLKD